MTIAAPVAMPQRKIANANADRLVAMPARMVPVSGRSRLAFASDQDVIEMNHKAILRDIAAIRSDATTADIDHAAHIGRWPAGFSTFAFSEDGADSLPAGTSSSIPSKRNGCTESSRTLN